MRSKRASKPRWKRTSGLRVLTRFSAWTWGFSRYLDIVGTSVRDSRKEQSIASITASAIGTNR